MNLFQKNCRPFAFLSLAASLATVLSSPAGFASPQVTLEASDGKFSVFWIDSHGTIRIGRCTADTLFVEKVADCIPEKERQFRLSPKDFEEVLYKVLKRDRNVADLPLSRDARAELLSLLSGAPAVGPNSATAPNSVAPGEIEQLKQRKQDLETTIQKLKQAEIAYKRAGTSASQASQIQKLQQELDTIPARQQAAEAGTSPRAAAQAILDQILQALRRPEMAPLSLSNAKEGGVTWLHELLSLVLVTLEKEGEKYRGSIAGLKFVALTGGSFRMGTDQRDHPYNEVPHDVTVSPFEIQTTEVTQKQYYEVMKSNPSFFSFAAICPSKFQQVGGVKMCPQYPVENVNWHQATAFATKLTELLDDGYIYRLPRAAEWEYAARGREGSEYPPGINDDNDWDKGKAYAWFHLNSGKETHAVGAKRPNTFGVFDLFGNVREWVQDWFSYTYRAKDGEVNPIGLASGTVKELRGSSWSAPIYCRATYRDEKEPTGRSEEIGFRLVRTRR